MSYGDYSATKIVEEKKDSTDLEKRDIIQDRGRKWQMTKGKLRAHIKSLPGVIPPNYKPKAKKVTPIKAKFNSGKKFSVSSVLDR